VSPFLPSWYYAGRFPRDWTAITLKALPRDNSGAVSKENVEIVRGVYDAWRRGDFEAALEPFHKDIEWIGPLDISRAGGEGVARGPEGVRRSVGRWLSTWVDYRFELGELLDFGDEVLAGGWQHGRGRASGVEVSEEIFSVWTLQAGKIVRQRMFRDKAQALEAAELRD
jgi:ketosteroid isomerase-like protein